MLITGTGSIDGVLALEMRDPFEKAYRSVSIREGETLRVDDAFRNSSAITDAVGRGLITITTEDGDEATQEDIADLGGAGSELPFSFPAALWGADLTLESFEAEISVVGDGAETEWLADDPLPARAVGVVAVSGKIIASTLALASGPYTMELMDWNASSPLNSTGATFLDAVTVSNAVGAKATDFFPDAKDGNRASYTTADTYFGVTASGSPPGIGENATIRLVVWYFKITPAT